MAGMEKITVPGLICNHRTQEDKVISFVGKIQLWQETITACRKS